MKNKNIKIICILVFCLLLILTIVIGCEREESGVEGLDEVDEFETQNGFESEFGDHSEEEADIFQPPEP